jgi:hypothetical protein
MVGCCWSLKFLFVVVFLYCSLLLAMPLPLVLWFSCHVNAHVGTLFVVVAHVNGCGVLCVVVTCHCPSTSSPSSSSYDFCHCHFGLLIDVAKSYLHHPLDLTSCDHGYHHGLLVVVAGCWLSLPLWCLMILYF